MLYSSVYHAGMAREAMVLPHDQYQLVRLERQNTCGCSSAVPDAVHEARMLAEFAGTLGLKADIHMPTRQKG